MELRKNKQLSDYLEDPWSTYSMEVVNNIQIIIFKNKLYTSLALCERVLNLYHIYLCHHGDTRLSKTIQLSYDWSGLINQAKVVARRYIICRKFKKTGKRKYGKLLAKQVETEP